MKAKAEKNGTTKEYHIARNARKNSWFTGRGLIPEAGPKRLLALVTFVNMLGSGIFMVSAALFYTRAVGLSLPEVGLGMGVAAAVGLLAGIPVGDLADRRGPREVYRLTLLVQAAAMAALTMVHTFLLFLVVVCVTELASSASRAARAPLVRGFGGPHLTRFRAYLRSVANLAGSLGAVAAGLAVQVDTRAAYLALVAGNALSFALCAAVISRMPHLPPVDRPPAGTGRWAALRDAPYLAVSLLDGLLWIQGDVLVFALPLWIVERTQAPRWLVGASAALNTGLVVAGQVRASRGIHNADTATRAIRRAGAAFLIGMALIAATAGMPGWLAVAVMAAGVAAHTAGELWHAAGSLELRVRLAPAHAQGQYSGVYGFGRGLAGVVAPSVLGLLCVTWGPPGWWLLGGVFVVIGLAMPLLARWAERAGPRAAQPG